MSENMTADLARLRELLERCPEEWKSASREGDDWDSVVYIPGTHYEICQCFHDEADKDQCEANTQLIAAMKNALPALLTELEQLRETTMQQAHHQRVVDAAAADIAVQRDRYKADAERLRDGVTIGTYAGKNGHRDWWTGGTWLQPGESVVVIEASFEHRLSRRGTTWKN